MPPCTDVLTGLPGRARSKCFTANDPRIQSVSRQLSSGSHAPSGYHDVLAIASQAGSSKVGSTLTTTNVKMPTHGQLSSAAERFIYESHAIPYHVAPLLPTTEFKGRNTIEIYEGWPQERSHASKPDLLAINPAGKSACLLVAAP